MSFNIMDWKGNLRNEIVEYIKDEEITNEDEMRSFIHEQIDNACIYNSECMEIIENLNAYDFSYYDIECTNISQVAYCSLLEETCDIDFDELKKEI